MGLIIVLSNLKRAWGVGKTMTFFCYNKQRKQKTR